MLNDFKDEDFDSKIKNEDISVIQFSAAWCGPCKALVPVMTKLSDEYKDKAGFYYADIEDGGINTGSAAGIRGVPTVIIYKKGVEVDRKVGGVPESHMKELKDKLNSFKNINYQESIQDAIRSIPVKENDIILITGSLYLAGEVLNLN